MIGLKLARLVWQPPPGDLMEVAETTYEEGRRQTARFFEEPESISLGVSSVLRIIAESKSSGMKDEDLLQRLQRWYAEHCGFNATMSESYLSGVIDELETHGPLESVMDP